MGDLFIGDAEAGKIGVGWKARDLEGGSGQHAVAGPQRKVCWGEEGRGNRKEQRPGGLMSA